MTKRPWSDFTGLRSQTFVHGLVDSALDIPPADLVAMKDYRKDERVKSCHGHDPIRIILAYAQDELAYDGNGKVFMPHAPTYAALPRERRLNKFGLSYRRDAQFWLHKTLADIVVGAAVHLYQTQGWITVLYDGFRSMEGAYKLYCFAPDKDINDGLLALPGQSAHNKALAVDSMMEDASGNEIDMGGHFDHLDMETNSRVYDGNAITPAARKNRLIRESAFLRSAFTQGLLIAPLRSEFWDDRLPENREDLWRVLDSAARCLGITLLTPDDVALRKKDRVAFRAKWESWSYDEFLLRWKETVKGREQELQALLGVTSPPPQEKPEFYHGNFNPLYDAALQKSGKSLT